NFESVRIRLDWRVRARIFSNRLTFVVFDLDRYGIARTFRKKIIDHRAVWRILAGRFVRRQRRVSVQVRANAQCRLRLKQKILMLISVELPQRRDVVENPKPAAMRRDDEIVVLDNYIAHGTRWQIQSQRLPVRTV